MFFRRNDNVGTLMTIPEAKNHAIFQLKNYKEKSEKLEEFLNENPKDVRVVKKLEDIKESIYYLQQDISHFEEIEKIIPVDRGGMNYGN